MDRGTFDILLNVFRPAVTREHAEGGATSGGRNTSGQR